MAICFVSLPWTKYRYSAVAVTSDPLDVKFAFIFLWVKIYMITIVMIKIIVCRQAGFYFST